MIRNINWELAWDVFKETLMNITGGTILQCIVFWFLCVLGVIDVHVDSPFFWHWVLLAAVLGLAGMIPCLWGDTLDSRERLIAAQNRRLRLLVRARELELGLPEAEPPTIEELFLECMQKASVDGAAPAR